MRRNNVVLSFQIAFTFIGAIIGAGFASGQEIVSFFVVFGNKGILGTIVTGILLAVLGGMIVTVVSKKGITNYKEYINFLFSPKIGRIFDVLLFIFLCCGLIVMLVASGSLSAKMWRIPDWIGFLVAVSIIYIGLLTGEEGLLWLNTALVPGMIIFALFVAGHAIFENSEAGYIAIAHNSLIVDNWLLSSVLYVAYNLVLGMVILSSLGKKPAAANITGAILGGLFLGVLAAFICQALLIQGEKIMGEEIPMLVLAAKIAPCAVWIYSFVLWAAIITTALSNGFGMLKRLQSRTNVPRALLPLLILLPSLPFMKWSLSSAVGIIYPILGYSGLIIIIAIIYKTIRLI